MSMRDDSCHKVYLDPIFCHTSDPRFTAGAALASTLVVLLTGALLTFSSPLKLSSLPQIATRGSMAVSPLTKSIRFVGVTQRPEMPCEQQTWPYIDQHCLVPVKGNPQTTTTPSPAQDDSKLSPLTATGAVPPLPLITATEPLEREAANGPARPDAALDDENDEVEEIPQQRVAEPVLEPHTHRHHGAHFDPVFLVRLFFRR